MSKTQWYTKSTYVLVALALVLSLGVVAVPMRGTVEANLGTHYYVTTTGNDSKSGLDWANAWKHISYAAANVPVGASSAAPNVIEVAAGLYDTTVNGENFPITFSNDNVMVLGVGPGNSIIDANDQEVNIIEIGTDSVDISGFTLRNARAYDWRYTGNGIYMDGSTNCDISNLEIYNLREGSGTWAREPAGIFMENSSNNNTFSSIEIHHIYSDYQPRGIWCHQCSGNQFTDINILYVDNTDGDPRENSCAYGMHLSGSSGNMFDEIMINSITGGNWSEGIELYLSHSNTFGDLSISDVFGDKYVYGILLLDSNDNTFGSSSEIWNIDAEYGCGIGIGMENNPNAIQGSNRNTFTSFDIHDTCYGFYISYSDSNQIMDSSIHDNGHGIYLYYAQNNEILRNDILDNSITVYSGIHVDKGCSGNVAHCNNIKGNGPYGIWNDPGNYYPMDATNNWWGDAYGPSLSPGAGDEVSANVLYEPYLSFVFQYCPQCGGALPPTPAAVPTVNHWGIFAMITLFAGLLVWRVRRRRLAS